MSTASQRKPTEIPPSRRERRKVERREAIYETALRLFTEKGYDAVSVEEITEAVDVSKGTFFNYFPAKEQILIAYRHAIYDEMHAYSESLEGTSGHKLFRQYAQKLARLLKREGQRYLMLHHALDRRRELREQDQGRFCRVLDLYVRYARIAVEAGELAPDTDVKLFAEMVLDLWIGNLIAWVNNPKAYSLERRILQKIDFLFRKGA